MNDAYDLVIIGGGSAGLTAVSLAVQLGARVALVERHRLGGDCTWTGCVPSKTLLKAARVAHQMRHADHHGLAPVDQEVDLKAVMAHVRDVIADVYEEESPAALRDEGVDVFLEEARFLDPHALAVGDVTLTFRHALIATGAHPSVPGIEGLDDVEYLTYETIWDLEVLPKRLLVVGAGPVGCEMSQAFRRLGSEVTLVSSRDRILPRDDAEAAHVLEEVFASEGIDVRPNSRAQRVYQEGGAIHVLTDDDQLVGDALMVATGRRPSVEGLDLEKAGVSYSARGIQVNDHLQTNQPGIYAAGDCLGGYQFTHYAGWQAFIATRNALLPGASDGILDRVPWTTFTDPELAHVGLTEEQARESLGDEVWICRWSMDQVDRARTEGATSGFIKLVLQKDGTLLGATAVAGRAGEMIQEWIHALEHGLNVGDLAEDIHVYPTYATASMKAAAEARIMQLLSGTSGQIIRGLRRLLR